MEKVGEILMNLDWSPLFISLKTGAAATVLAFFLGIYAAGKVVKAKPAAKAVAAGTCEKGIVICTTGIGISISANKVKGIRCALCSEPLSAKMTRLHNDANMLAMGAGIVGENLALEIVETFLNTPFSGEERHSRRISLIEEI